MGPSPFLVQSRSRFGHPFKPFSAPSLRRFFSFQRVFQSFPRQIQLTVSVFVMFCSTDLALDMARAALDGGLDVVSSEK
jgi:hypothetical protein